MGSNTAAFLRWAPRVAGVLTALFIGLFALDAFDGRSFVEGLPYFLVHLVPSFVLLALVAVSWRYQWVGGVAFIVLAVAYGVMVGWRIDWVLVISGPLAAVGVLFLASWHYRTTAGAAW